MSLWFQHVEMTGSRFGTTVRGRRSSSSALCFAEGSFCRANSNSLNFKLKRKMKRDLGGVVAAQAGLIYLAY